MTYVNPFSYQSTGDHGEKPLRISVDSVFSVVKSLAGEFVETPVYPGQVQRV
jgi:hypothetical protein